jgi:hypothetical protein
MLQQLLDGGDLRRGQLGWDVALMPLISAIVWAISIPFTRYRTLVRYQRTTLYHCVS